MFHVLVQTNFRRYYFYVLPDQAQVLLDHFNDWTNSEAKCQLDSTTDEEFPHIPPIVKITRFAESVTMEVYGEILYPFSDLNEI